MFLIDGIQPSGAIGCHQVEVVVAWEFCTLQYVQHLRLLLEDSTATSLLSTSTPTTSYCSHPPANSMSAS